MLLPLVHAVGQVRETMEGEYELLSSTKPTLLLCAVRKINMSTDVSDYVCLYIQNTKLMSKFRQWKKVVIEPRGAG